MKEGSGQQRQVPGKLVIVHVGWEGIKTETARKQNWEGT